MLRLRGLLDLQVRPKQPLAISRVGMLGLLGH